MNNLITELERAIEGSRELDHEIFLATHPKQGTTREGGEYRYAAHLDEDGRPWVALPQYTTSLDAALTLVPEGWDWLVRSDVGGLSFANILKGDLPVMQNGRQVNPNWQSNPTYAATSALALCIAALHARQVMEE